jgi:hypothetical protein
MKAIWLQEMMPLFVFSVLLFVTDVALAIWTATLDGWFPIFSAAFIGLAVWMAFHIWDMIVTCHRWQKDDEALEERFRSLMNGR